MHRESLCHARVPFRAPRSRLAPLLRWLAEAAERQHSRRQLQDLDDRSLRDLGLSRLEAEAEARKPFWR